MPNKSDEHLLQRLRRKVDDHSFPYEYSCLYSDLLIDQVNALSPYIHGIPLVFFTKPTKEWTVLCTRHAIGFDNHQYYTVPYEDMETVKPAVFDNITDLGEKLMAVKRIGKVEWHELTVSTKDGKNYVFHANKGSEFFSMYNLILSAQHLINSSLHKKLSFQDLQEGT
jgi:hypothetical protein